MKDLTNNFGVLYFPVKAFVLFRKNPSDYRSSCYVESYDMDSAGKPINAHPLSSKEGQALAKALTTKQQKEESFLKPEGLLPDGLLYLNSGKNAFAIWQTPAMEAALLFDKQLTIPCGKAGIPSLIWRADRSGLQVFAVKDKTASGDSPLYHAPFFNLSGDGRVCMGNVKVNIPKNCGLEKFIALWQGYFFNSYFTHLLGGFNPVKGNIVQLWQKLMDTPEKFPPNLLIPVKRTLKTLLP